MREQVSREAGVFWMNDPAQANGTISKIVLSAWDTMVLILILIFFFSFLCFLFVNEGVCSTTDVDFIIAFRVWKVKSLPLRCRTVPPLSRIWHLIDKVCDNIQDSTIIFHAVLLYMRVLGDNLRLVHLCKSKKAQEQQYISEKKSHFCDWNTNAHEPTQTRRNLQKGARTILG